MTDRPDTGKLRACPFCGSDDVWNVESRAVNRLEDRPERRAVQCQACSAFAPIGMWNQRADYIDSPGPLPLEWRGFSLFLGECVVGGILPDDKTRYWNYVTGKFGEFPISDPDDAQAALEAHIRAALGGFVSPAPQDGEREKVLGEVREWLAHDADWEWTTHIVERFDRHFPKGDA